ncbi:aldolase/citrate lyase family protein [Corticibacterium sp. UT-5YL-CI-8]|nr:aldolase/citrate lyase family protein [Tianweitania sp. UT-5YL-CI-8]
MIGPHRLRRKLEAKQPVIGMMVGFPSPWFVDMLALSGFDFVVIDAEHGSIDPGQAEVMVRAAEGGGMSVLARVPNVAHEILRFLDIGVLGIQVPHIHDAEDTRAAVDAIRYPPHGKRGLATITRAAGYGIDVTAKDYVEIANRELLCCPMIETVEALQNVDAIASTPGVDVLILGPGDLSNAMGHGGDRTHPEVKAACALVINRAHAHGRWVSQAAYDGEGAREAFLAGADIVIPSPMAMVTKAGRDFVKRATDF